MLDFCEGLLYAFAAPNDCPVSVKMSKNSSAICYYFYTQISANYYMILIPNPECFGHFGRIPLLFTTNLRVIWLKICPNRSSLPTTSEPKTWKNDVNPRLPTVDAVTTTAKASHAPGSAFGEQCSNPYDMNHKILIGIFVGASQGVIHHLPTIGIFRGKLAVSFREGLWNHEKKPLTVHWSLVV